jgi:endonuclease-3
VVVDTHVMRVAQRLGWTRSQEAEVIEQDLCKLLPREDWDPVSHTLIFHGRRICFARKPNCEGCGVNQVCPSAFHAENVGRKPSRVRVPAARPARVARAKGTPGKKSRQAANAPSKKDRRATGKR